jgi:hypothetical protein
MYEVGVL